METTPAYDMPTLNAALGLPHLYMAWDCGCIALGPPERLRLDACKQHRVLGMRIADVYRPAVEAIAS